MRREAIVGQSSPALTLIPVKVTTSASGLELSTSLSSSFKDDSTIAALFDGFGEPTPTPDVHDGDACSLGPPPPDTNASRRCESWVISSDLIHPG